jgi:division protein CdvB (Snf7/Vps24/ESCRT-III family)
LEKVGKEQVFVEGVQQKATVEEEKVNKIADEVSIQEADCKKNLTHAEPAIIEAEKALNTLNKPNLTELKSLETLPPDVMDVGESVLCILSPASCVIKDTS